MDCIANRVISNTNKLHQSYGIIHYTDTLWLSSHSQIDCNKHRYFVGAIRLQSLTKCVQTASPKVKINRDKTRMLLQNSHFITKKITNLCKSTSDAYIRKYVTQVCTRGPLGLESIPTIHNYYFRERSDIDV
jgi:hypothetical protein